VNETRRVASDGEVGSVAVFADNKAALAFAVNSVGVARFLLSAQPSILSFLSSGKLERGLTPP